MGTTDNNGVYFYEDTDAVSPLHTLLNTGQTSVSNALNAAPRIFPTATEATRNALLTQRGSSAAKPLFVYRQELQRVEYHDGTRWHVTSDTTIGRGVYTGAAVAAGTPAWTSLTSVNATSLGGPVAAEVNLFFRNGNSGAPRTMAMRMLIDNVEMAGGGRIMGAPYVAGMDLPMSASYSWETTPPAGGHSWVLQVNASSGAAVIADAATLRIVERT